MNLNAELLRLYRTTSLADLLDQTAAAFSKIGLPHLVMKWTPAAGSHMSMRENSSIVWSNFSSCFGDKAAEIYDLLQESVAIGLEQARSNTLERQNWRLEQDGVYQLSADAPKPFFLTQYQKSIIRDFGEPEWREFFVLPLSRERERVLVLEAKTQKKLSKDAVETAKTTFSVFACVYQGLHRPELTGVAGDPSDVSKSYLSRREIQCLQWLAAGKTLSEAATILGISERTLRFHVNNAKQKLGVSTTIQTVVAAALEYGFDPRDPRRSLYQSSRTPAQPDVREAS